MSPDGYRAQCKAMGGRFTGQTAADSELWEFRDYGLMTVTTPESLSEDERHAVIGLIQSRLRFRTQ